MSKDFKPIVPRMWQPRLVFDILMMGMLDVKKEKHDGTFIGEFYREHLKMRNDLYIVGGELEFALGDTELINLFRSRLKEGGRISIIAGPEIQTDDNGSNPLIDLLEEEFLNFSLFYVDENNASGFHFSIAGRDVLMERQHSYDTPLGYREVHITRKSIARRYDCVRIFIDIAKRSHGLSSQQFRRLLFTDMS